MSPQMQEEKKMDDDSANDIIMDQNNKPVMSVKNLNFSYTPDRKDIVNLNCIVPPNSKVILVGANGMCRYVFFLCIFLCICVFFHLSICNARVHLSNKLIISLILFDTCFSH